MEKQQIGNTPLSMSIYSVDKTPTMINADGVLEIILCLKGSVNFTYSYEEFTLREGEYISVDRDAYYLYNGKDNVCVSFYIDLNKYKDQYHFISSTLFICEGIADEKKAYLAPVYNQLLGVLVTILKNICTNAFSNGNNNDLGNPIPYESLTQKIVDIFINNFDISFYHSDTNSIDEESLTRLHEINDYMYKNMKNKIRISDLAKKLNLSESYVSEFIRKNSLGFREMLGYMRASESEKYLLTTDKTIIEISEECGFSDVKYYYSAFKKWCKCTPNQFRIKYGQNTDKKIDYLSASDIADDIDKLLVLHYLLLFSC